MKKLFETRFQRFNWERDAGTGRLLSDVGSMASRMSPEELRELTERCLAHSSYEIAAWLRDAAAVGRLPGPLPELE